MAHKGRTPPPVAAPPGYGTAGTNDPRYEPKYQVTADFAPEIGRMYVGGDVEKAITTDGAYFLAHPELDYFARPTVPGEFPDGYMPENGVTYVIRQEENPPDRAPFRCRVNGDQPEALRAMLENLAETRKGRN